MLDGYPVVTFRLEGALQHTVTVANQTATLSLSLSLFPSLLKPFDINKMAPSISKLNRSETVPLKQHLCAERSPCQSDFRALRELSLQFTL